MRHQNDASHCSGMSIVKFEHISHLVLVLLASNIYLAAWSVLCWGTATWCKTLIIQENYFEENLQTATYIASKTPPCDKILKKWGVYIYYFQLSVVSSRKFRDNVFSWASVLFSLRPEKFYWFLLFCTHLTTVF